MEPEPSSRAADARTVPEVTTVQCELRVGNRRGPTGPAGRRGRKVTWGPFPPGGVEWLRKWTVDLAAGASVDAIWLYAGPELILATAARGAEKHAAGEEAAFQAEQELSEIDNRLAERRAEQKTLEGRLEVLRQQVLAEEAALSRAQREAAEARARADFEVAALAEHVKAEREAARQERREIQEHNARERAQLQETARLERERNATERAELAAAMKSERETFATERKALHDAQQTEMEALRLAHRTERDRMETDLQRERDRHQARIDRLEKDIEKAIEDAKRQMAGSLQTASEVEATMAQMVKNIRKLTEDIVEGDQTMINESITRKVTAASEVRLAETRVKENLTQAPPPTVDVNGEIGKAFAKVLGRVDPHKVLGALGPGLRKMLAKAAADDDDE